MNSQSFVKTSLLSIFSAEKDIGQRSKSVSADQKQQHSAFGNIYALLFSAKDKNIQFNKGGFFHISPVIRDKKLNGEEVGISVKGKNINVEVPNKKITSKKHYTDKKNIVPLSLQSQLVVDADLDTKYRVSENTPSKKIGGIKGNLTGEMKNLLDGKIVNKTHIRQHRKTINIDAYENKPKLQEKNLKNQVNGKMGIEAESKQISGKLNKNLKLVDQVETENKENTAANSVKNGKSMNVNLGIKSVPIEAVSKGEELTAQKENFKSDHRIAKSQKSSKINRVENLKNFGDNNKEIVNASNKFVKQESGKIKSTGKFKNIAADKKVIEKDFNDEPKVLSKKLEINNDNANQQNSKAEETNPAETILGNNTQNKIKFKSSVQRNNVKLIDTIGADKNIKIDFTNAHREGLKTGNVERTFAMDMADTFLEMKQRKDPKLTVLLNPPSMGRLKIELTQTKDGIEARLIVENKAVKELIISAVSDIKDAISKHGVDLREMFVEMNLDQSGGRSTHQELYKNRNTEKSNYSRSTKDENDGRDFTEDHDKNYKTRYFGYNSIEIIA